MSEINQVSVDGERIQIRLPTPEQIGRIAAASAIIEHFQRLTPEENERPTVSADDRAGIVAAAAVRHWGAAKFWAAVESNRHLADDRILTKLIADIVEMAKGRQ